MYKTRERKYFFTVVSTEGYSILKNILSWKSKIKQGRKNVYRSLGSTKRQAPLSFLRFSEGFASLVQSLSWLASYFLFFTHAALVNLDQLQRIDFLGKEMSCFAL